MVVGNNYEVKAGIHVNPVYQASIRQKSTEVLSVHKFSCAIRLLCANADVYYLPNMKPVYLLLCRLLACIIFMCDECNG